MQGRKYRNPLVQNDRITGFQTKNQLLAGYPILGHKVPQRMCTIPRKFPTMFGRNTHLKIQFGGRGLDIAPWTAPFVAPFPKHFFVIGIPIAHLAIQPRNPSQIAGLIRADPVTNTRQMRPSLANPTFRIHLQLNPIRGNPLPLPGQNAFFKIQRTTILRGWTQGKVGSVTVDRPRHIQPVGAVEDFGEVLGVTVFPPTYPGLVGVINTGDVGTLKRMTAVGLLVHGTLPKESIAQTKNTFGGFVQRGIPALLGHGPGIDPKQR